MNGVIEQFKKDFAILEDLSEVEFIHIKKENYKNEDHENSFGEKLRTVYTLNFSIFNVIFSVKILVFLYDNFHEVLKLDLHVQDVLIEKEIAVCRNFLQRQRNLNSTFLTLKKISRCFESRRLIIDIVLKKEPRISLIKNYEDGTVGIKYKNDSPNIFIAIGWKIEWDLKNCDIIDSVEIYYKNFDLPNSTLIKEELESLTHPSLDFSTKLKIWRQLFSYLSEYDRRVQATIKISDNEHDNNVLVISDSDDEKNQLDTTYNKRKRRKLHNNILSSSQVINVAE